MQPRVQRRNETTNPGARLAMTFSLLRSVAPSREKLFPESSALMKIRACYPSRLDPCSRLLHHGAPTVKGKERTMTNATRAPATGLRLAIALLAGVWMVLVASRPLAA